MKIAKHTTTSLIVVIILLAYVSFLLTTNYTSQTSLQQTLLDQFQMENTWRSSSLSYFFNDRREDMMNLASSREIEVFYENRALGMSMEYGLKQSLPPIQERFISLLNHHRINQEAVYLRIALLDDKGAYLVQAQSTGPASTFPRDATRLLNPDHRTGAVLADSETRAVLISTAYVFKGKYSGQIVAWLNPDYITRHILIARDTSDRKNLLVENSGMVYLPTGSLVIADAQGRPENVPFRFKEKKPGVPPQDMIGLSIPVNNTPFFLLTVAPAPSVLGMLDPRGLLVGMGVLALAIMGSGIYIERTLRQSLVLQAGLNASRQHEQEAREKNLQLETEINERKRAEEALRTSHNSLQAIIDNIDAIVYVADMQTYEVLLINKYARERFGDVDGKICWQALQTNQDGPCSFCSNSKLVGAEGKPLDTHVWEFQNTINKRWYECRDKAIKWIDDRTVRLEIATDITERKTMAAEILNVQKIESVGILAGGIAHDFNNLLQVIVGNISLAKTQLHEPAPGYLLSCLDRAEEASLAAKELSFRLLTFAKGGEPLRTICSVDAVLRKAARLSLSGSNITGDIVLPHDLYPIEADDGQLTQVFNNLLINAKEAMPDGGTVRIQASNAMISEADPLPLNSGDYVKIAIQDSGAGIPKEVLPNIFDPYFTTKDRCGQKGSGLGLAISLSIIKKHGGHISVETREGLGTTFNIFIPVSWKGSQKKQKKPTGALQPASRKRILFMDDEDGVRESIGAMMEYLGHEIEYARNGEEAIDLFRKALKTGNTFDGVILDLTVKGGLGGDKAVVTLLELDPQVKAAISSGYADNPVMMHFRDHGFIAAIKKPFTMEQLKELFVKL